MTDSVLESIENVDVIVGITREDKWDKVNETMSPGLI